MLVISCHDCDEHIQSVNVSFSLRLSYVQSNLHVTRCVSVAHVSQFKLTKLSDLLNLTEKASSDNSSSIFYINQIIILKYK